MWCSGNFLHQHCHLQKSCCKSATLHLVLLELVWVEAFIIKVPTTLIKVLRSSLFEYTSCRFIKVNHCSFTCRFFIFFILAQSSSHYKCPNYTHVTRLKISQWPHCNSLLMRFAGVLVDEGRGSRESSNRLIYTCIPARLPNSLPSISIELKNLTNFEQSVIVRITPGQLLLIITAMKERKNELTGSGPLASPFYAQLK